MSSITRHRHRLVPIVVAGVLTAVAGAGLTSPSQAAQAGPTAGPLTVDNNVSILGFDLATDGDGTSYLGWISSSTSNNRTVHLCVLPIGATGCQGGVRSTSALDGSTATGIQVIATGTGSVTLAWFHDTATASSTPDGGAIGSATYTSGTLSGSADVAPAPSHGALLRVAKASDGTLYALTQNGSGSDQKIQVRAGLAGAPHELTAPWSVGTGFLAFSGSKVVVAVDRGGYVTQPVQYAVGSGSTWSSFKTANKTWNDGNAVGMVTTSRGVRLVASQADAGYHPRVLSFNGNSFGKPAAYGDNNACAPNAHDLVTDASGRMADVSNECDTIAVANFADTRHAGIVRFKVGTVTAGYPQITTTPSGHAWVAYGQYGTTSANKLVVRPVLLPALLTSRRSKNSFGEATLTGPASCLPVVSAKVDVKAKGKGGWSVRSTDVRAGAKKVGSSINGASLAAGSSHTLKATIVFAKGGARKVVHLTLTFRACPAP